MESFTEVLSEISGLIFASFLNHICAVLSDDKVSIPLSRRRHGSGRWYIPMNSGKKRLLREYIS